MGARICNLIIVSLGLFAASVAVAQAQLQAPVSALYGAHWRVDGNTDTELTLRNLDETRATSARLTLYGEDGSVTGSKNVTLSARGRQVVAFSDLVTTSWGAANASGGFSVTWQDPTLSLVGSYVLEDARTPVATPVDMVSSYVSDTEMALGTGWYLPDRATTGELTLFNSSVQPARVTVSSGGGTSAGSNFTTVLAAHASADVSLRSIVGADAQGTGTLLVRYSGTARALVPSLGVVSSTGFALSSHFFGIQGAAPSRADSLLFPQIAQPVGLDNQGVRTRTQLLLSNPGDTSIAPTGTAFLADATQHKSISVALRLPALAPYSATLVDITGNLAGEKAGLLLLSLSLTAPTGADSLGAEVFAVDESSSATAQSVGEIAWNSPEALPWSLASRVNLTPSLTGIEGSASPNLVFVNGAHVESYAVAGGTATSAALALSLTETFADRAPDMHGMRLPQGLSQGLLLVSAAPNLSVLNPRVCYALCPPSAPASATVQPEAAMTTAQAAVMPQESSGTCQSTINLTRNNISQTTAVGKPQNGYFTYSVAPTGSNNASGATIATYSTTNTSQDPNPAVIGNTLNTGAPIQGGLAKLSATYTCNTYGTVSPAVTWNVATFGTSCYHIALQSDYFTQTGGCKSNFYRKTQTTYSGTTVNPTGFPPGTYCLLFVEDVAIQGTARLNNGTYVHFNGARSPFPDCPNTNCTFAAGQAGVTLIVDGSVAADLNLVKRHINVELATNTPGQSKTYEVTDAGGSSSISKYRLDLYEGAGAAVCVGFHNDVRVASCNANSTNCPQQISKP